MPLVSEPKYDSEERLLPRFGDTEETIEVIV